MKFSNFYKNEDKDQGAKSKSCYLFIKSNIFKFCKVAISCILAISLITMLPGSSFANTISDAINSKSFEDNASFEQSVEQNEDATDSDTSQESDASKESTTDESSGDDTTEGLSDNGSECNEACEQYSTLDSEVSDAEDTYTCPNDDPCLSRILEKDASEKGPFQGIISTLIKILVNEITTAIEALVEEWASKDGDYAIRVGKDGEDTVIYINEKSFPKKDGSDNWSPSYGGGIVIHGHVTFVIKDGVTFTVGKTLSDQDICEAGFLVSGDGNSLTICAGNDEGQTVRGSGQLVVYGGNESAAIGGTENTNRDRPNNGTNITIESSTVYAYGGGCAAAIGGGRYGCSDNIEINGGHIYAAGGSRGAGIGSGASGGTWNGPTIDWYKNDGQKVGGQGITINGGTVEAKGGRGAAGIGGGWDSDGHNIVINGGTVKATGGEDGGSGQYYYVDPACAIGSGDNYLCTCRGYNICVSGGSVEAIPGGAHAAGIGSSSGERSWGIKIDGGKVVAYAGECAAAIGGGYYCENESGWIEIAGDAEVRVNENTTYSGSEYTGIGSGVGGGFQTCENIKIGGCANIVAYGNQGAAIGSGRNGQAGDIEFSEDCKVYAKNYAEGAAIGSGKNYGEVGIIKFSNTGNICVEAHTVSDSKNYSAVGWGKKNNGAGSNYDVRIYKGLTCYRSYSSSQWDDSFVSDTDGDCFKDKLKGRCDIKIVNEAYAGATLSAQKISTEDPTVGYESSTDYEITSNFIHTTNMYDVEWYSDSACTTTTDAPAYANVVKNSETSFDVITCPDQDLADYGITPAGTYYFKVKGDFNGETYYSDSLIFKVEQQKVNIKSGSASKIWDGTPLKCETVTGDEIVIAKKTSTTNGSEPFEIKDTILEDTNKFASQTDLGSCSNTFNYTIKSKYISGNYDVSQSYGTLTVQNETPIVYADDIDCLYDGETHIMTVTSVIDKVGADITDSCDLQYSTDGEKTWIKYSDSKPSIKDAGNATVTWKVTIGDTEYKNCTNTMSVSKRQITLSSQTASKEYDGTALTATEVKQTGDGLVEGESFVSGPSATESITQVGSKQNTISYTMLENVEKNYTITKSEGTLTVTPKSAPITISTASATKMYDGTKLTACSDTDWSFAGALADGDKLTVTFTFNNDTVLDEEEPTKDEAINVGTYQNKIASYVVKNNNGSGDDVTNCYTFGDTKCGTLTINPRNITMTSGSAWKTADGSPLTKEEVTVTGDTLAGETETGESGIVYSDFKEVTEVSYTPVDNTFTYAAGSSSKFIPYNYNITIVYGKLMIVDGISIMANDQTFVYDGTDHEAKAEITASSEGEPAYVWYSYSTDKEKWSDFSTTVPKLKDAGVLYIKAYGTKGGQTTETVEYSATVNPRPVTITTTSASKMYDGIALKKNDSAKDAVVSGQGFVSGQEPTITIKGSQTDVGSSKNTFECKFNTGVSEDNYNITEAPGTLTVVKNTAPICITTKSDNQAYNYTALTCNDYEATFGGKDVGDDGKLCENDVLSVVTTGSIIDVGTTQNTCEYRVMRGNQDVTSFYTFEDPTLGTLRVTPRSVILSTSSAAKVYDGDALTANFTEGETVDYTIGGDGFVADQGFKTINITGTRTDAGTSKNNVDYTLNEQTKASNYNITKEPGTLTVSKRKVTVTSGSKISTWSGCESEGKIYNKDTCQISGDKFVDGEVQTGYPKGKTELVRPTTEPEYSVEAKNAIDFGWTGNGNPSNYEITQNLGTLMIVKDADAGAVATGYEGVYDGQSHKGEIKTTLESPTITYKVDDEGAEQTNEPVFTDVCNHTVYVTIKKDGLVATCSYKIVITARDLKLNAGSASKIYDGTALTCSDYTIEGDGFADNEAQTISMTEASTITNVKLDEQGKIDSVNNEIKTLSDSGSFKKSNYNISYTNGSLKILKRPAIVYSLPLGWGKDTNLDDSGDNEAVKVVYDGKTHDQQKTVEVGKGQVPGIPEIPTMGFVKDQGISIKNWQSFTDAGYYKNTFDYDKIGSTNLDNYALKTLYGVVKITPRDIILSSASDSKMYDGTPLTNENVTDSGEYGGFVEGEGATYEVTGSQTEVGVSANTFTYALNTTSNSETKAINYNITTDEGALTVYDNNTLRIECHNQQYEYDGNPHGEPAKAYIGDTPCDSTIFYSTDGGKLWDSDVAQLTEPGTLDVMVHVDKRGYERAEGSYKIIVTNNQESGDVTNSVSSGTSATGDFGTILACCIALLIFTAGAVTLKVMYRRRKNK